MIRSRSISRLAVLGVLAGALALGACGRKGPLDAPPGGAPVAGQTGQTQQPPQTDQFGQPVMRNDNLVGRSAPSSLPVIRGEDKRIPLDALLN